MSDIAQHTQLENLLEEHGQKLDVPSDDLQDPFKALKKLNDSYQVFYVHMSRKNGEEYAENMGIFGVQKCIDKEEKVVAYYAVPQKIMSLRGRREVRRKLSEALAEMKT